MTGARAQPGWREILLEEPFRLFFALGVLSTVAGVAPWVLYFFGLGSGYPGYDHGLVQIQGFEMAFAVGFLMTAVPRFLEVPGTRMWELALGLALCAGGTLLTTFGAPVAGQGLYLALGVHISLFTLRRLRGRGDDPPPFFAFLPIGLVSATGGAALILWPVAGLLRLGELLVEQGILLTFVLTIGSHLGPRLLYGHRGFPETTTPAAHRRLLALFVLGLVLLASFPLEAAGYARAGLLLRAVVVTGYLFGVLRVYRRPTQARLHIHLLRLSFWSIAGGLWLAALAPGPGAASLHLTFVGGFGLMTFVIATRVTVGHAGFEDLWEQERLVVAAPLLLITFSVPLRLAADAFPKYYLALLAAASAMWLGGVVVWGAVFIPKMAPWHVAADE